MKYGDIRQGDVLVQETREATPFNFNSFGGVNGENVWLCLKVSQQQLTFKKYANVHLVNLNGATFTGYISAPDDSEFENWTKLC